MEIAHRWCCLVLSAYVRRQTFLTSRRLLSHRDARLDGGVLAQRYLDFAEFDTESAHFDLVIQASQVFKGSIRKVAGQISGAVDARRGGRVRRGERVRQEALLSELWTVQVAACYPIAANVKFARHANGNRLQIVIQHVDLRIGNGMADADGDLNRADLAEGG